ncbi:ankyrin repeat domain-containing protein [Amycolatopsis umgeniensis]|uniref:Ankyrin repeat protein n=1 Tax=Amycolatopsis umgeniensis TaxID=336628 RepID=A0A841BFZ9_9PSEU|nr:ankyrin repeat domain-containing protein [Amycolatopsis umgeniensis]MBB5857930.1 ankyrin repeat protein [Amycolatopsis umgeniensis]
MTENPGQAEEFDPELLALWAKVFAFARSGATADLTAYVDAGVSANLTNDRGDTLVMLAAYHGHAETVSALIERGADPNRENDRGQSPLAGAVFKNEPEVVKALLKGGADATAGEPSAIDAARMFGNTELLTLLES